MTTKDLRNSVEKVLGNNIRCLLPSYWWKRLFHQVADTIDEVNGVDIVSSKSALNRLDAPIGSLASIANKKTMKPSECYVPTDEDSNLADEELVAKLTRLTGLEVSFPLPDITGVEATAILVGEDTGGEEAWLGFLVISEGFCAAMFSEGEQKIFLLTSQSSVNSLNAFLKQHKFYYVGLDYDPEDTEEYIKETTELFDQIFTIVDCTSDVYVKGLAWERLAKEGESASVPSYTLYYTTYKKNGVTTMADKYINLNKEEYAKITASQKAKENYLLQVVELGSTEEYAPVDVELSWFSVADLNDTDANFNVTVCSFLEMDGANQPQRRLVSFKSDGTAEYELIPTGDVKFLYYADGTNSLSAKEKAHNASAILPIKNSFSSSFTPSPIIIRYKIDNTKYLSLQGILSGIDAEGDGVSLTAFASHNQYFRFNYDLATGEPAKAEIIQTEGGEGSYDDTEIKKDIADLQAKGTQHDAQLTELSSEVNGAKISFAIEQGKEVSPYTQRQEFHIPQGDFSARFVDNGLLKYSYLALYLFDADKKLISQHTIYRNANTFTASSDVAYIGVYVASSQMNSSGNVLVEFKAEGLSVGLKEEIKDIATKVAEIDERVLTLEDESSHLTLEGAKETLVEKKYYNFTAGETYNVILRNAISADTIQLGDGYTIFGIAAYNTEGKISDLVKIVPSMIPTMGTSYSFTIPSGTEYLRVIGRCDIGTTIDMLFAIVPKDVVQAVESIKVVSSQLNETERQIDSIIAENTKLKEDMSPLYDVQFSEGGEKQVLQLGNDKGGKYIISVHRRARDEKYKASNDVFFPDARKDFADVRFSTPSGETLSQRVLYKGNIDVLRLANFPTIHGGIREYNGVLYCGSEDSGIYKSEDGFTWSNMQELSEGLEYSVVIPIVSEKGYMLIGNNGILYKSSYPFTTKKVVLDTNTYHPNSTILGGNMAMDDNGYLYFGHYQEERDLIVQKSTDDGETWSVCYRDDTGKYQHVHAIKYDEYSKAIYVGCDGGGGLLRSKDKGVTFVDLREQNPSMPQSTDNGLSYWEKGYRLFGGETSIVGGYSVIKTTDDITFRGVLAAGKACYVIKRVDGYLIATLLSSQNYNTAQLLYSEDDGETWKLLYTTACHDNGGVSDGFRTQSQIGDKLYVIAQGRSFDNMMVKVGGDNYYAQVLVDVPQGISEIEVASGYAIRKSKDIVNENRVSQPLFYAALNETKGIYYLGGTHYDNGKVYETENGGRSIADIYPPIRSVWDGSSCIMNAAPFFTGTMTIPNTFHIGFWMKSMQSAELTILESSSLKMVIKNGWHLYVNDTYFYNMNFPKVEGCYIRVDINVTRGGNVDVYVNGRMMARASNTCPSFSNTMELELLKGSGFILQHFDISEGHVSAEDAQTLYDGNLHDFVG